MISLFVLLLDEEDDAVAVNDSVLTMSSLFTDNSDDEVAEEDAKRANTNDAGNTTLQHQSYRK
jgi:hypothetical protein